MTLTVCVDGNIARTKRPGVHVNRWGRQLRSVRVWWMWIAVAWYRLDDVDLVQLPHDWSDDI